MFKIITINEQKKFNLKLSGGGDTTYSNKVSYSVTTIRIILIRSCIERNKVHQIK